MSIKDEYVRFKLDKKLDPGLFEHRVRLQDFLKERLEAIWAEGPQFTHGGLVKNRMTGFAIGFAYYDCRPSAFCRTRCYGLPLAGLFDYNMLRLAVLTSESLKTGDQRFLKPLAERLQGMENVKIGHWGDAVPEQVSVMAKLVADNPCTTFWWYTRKKEIALQANRCDLPNLRAYLSLDPTTEFPSFSEYPFCITYFVADGQCHAEHARILEDPRLVAVFLRKKGASIEDPRLYGVESHPKLYLEKKLRAQGKDKDTVCLSCAGRCRFQRAKLRKVEADENSRPQAR